MALASGVRLGPYEIVSQIGAGGMGEVYKATDTRLHRTVAIKVFRRISPAIRNGWHASGAKRRPSPV